MYIHMYIMKVQYMIVISVCVPSQKWVCKRFLKHTRPNEGHNKKKRCENNGKLCVIQ